LPEAMRARDISIDDNLFLIKNIFGTNKRSFG
jgi:hypothetical protein